MKEFCYIHGFSTIESLLEGIVKANLSNLLSSSVQFSFTPISSFKKQYGIDVLENEKREVYLVDNNSVIIVSRIKQKKVVYLLGLVFSSPLINDNNIVFNGISKGLSEILSSCSHDGFAVSFQSIGEKLMSRIVAKCIFRAFISSAKGEYIIEQYFKLRNTTFEGKHFSTGLIITPSRYNFERISNYGDGGILLPLNKKEPLFKLIDRRFWYLADGLRTFYLTNGKCLEVLDLFVYSSNNSTFLSSATLNNVLRGNDVLIRTGNGSDVSVIDSNGNEFIHQENIWRYRDYRSIKDRVLSTLPSIKENVYNAFLYFILYCSKNGISTIIWIPHDVTKINPYVLQSTLNRFSSDPISVASQENTPLIKRILSSDGTTIFSPDGNLLYYGCFVDISKAKEIKGLSGTGETAARVLAGNGLAIKVSQDGIIKFFFERDKEPIKF